MWSSPLPHLFCWHYIGRQSINWNYWYNFPKICGSFHEVIASYLVYQLLFREVLCLRNCERNVRIKTSFWLKKVLIKELTESLVYIDKIIIQDVEVSQSLQLAFLIMLLLVSKLSSSCLSKPILWQILEALGCFRRRMKKGSVDWKQATTFMRSFLRIRIVSFFVCTSAHSTAKVKRWSCWSTPPQGNDPDQNKKSHQHRSTLSQLFSSVLPCQFT